MSAITVVVFDEISIKRTLTILVVYVDINILLSIFCYHLFVINNIIITSTIIIIDFITILIRLIDYTVVRGLTRSKTYDWKDSNVALIGSDLDKRVKSRVAVYFNFN